MARIPESFGRREQPALAVPVGEPGTRGLHVAGHPGFNPGSDPGSNPEPNNDIDPDGSDRNGLGALCRKQAFTERADADMTIAARVRCEVKPVTARAERPSCAGIASPVHVGVADSARADWAIEFTSQLRAAPPAAPAGTA